MGDAHRNLLLMVMRSGLTRPWSFSRLATTDRITMMYYVDFYSLFNQPDKDWKNILNSTSEGSHEPSLFDGGLEVRG